MQRDRGRNLSHTPENMPQTLCACTFAHASLLTQVIVAAQGEAPIWETLPRAAEQSALWDMPVPSLQGLSLDLSNSIPRTSFPIIYNLQAKPSVGFNSSS